MEHHDVVTEIRTATEEVCSMMLGVEVVAGEPLTEQGAPGPTDGVVSLIGMAGPWVGTGSLSCSADAACHLSSKFLMAEYDAVNEEVLDAIAELTNMIIGGFKTKIEEKFGSMGLSIPTVIFGRNFTTRTVSTNNWTLVPFTVGEEKFDIHVTLAPNESKPKEVRPGYTELHIAASK